MTATTIAVRGFGGFSLSVNGDMVDRWRAGKARDLLQFMLLRPSKVVSRDTLCDVMWPGAPLSADTCGSLKVAVHMLRRILAERGASKVGDDIPSLRLETHQAGYVLQAHQLWIDFELFDRLIDRGHEAESADSPDEAVAHYQRAAELYTGDFLYGQDSDWISVHREWLRSRYLYALRQLTNAALAKSDHLSVLRWARHTIEIEPFNEHAYRALMTAHTRLGELNQVRRWYKLCVERLRKEAQVSPEPETRNVYIQSMRSADINLPT